MVTRRQLIERGLVAGVGATALSRSGVAQVLAAAGREPLAAGSIRQFVDPLPELEVVRAGRGRIELRMSEFRTQVLPRAMPQTWVWGISGRASRVDPPTWGR